MCYNGFIFIGGTVKNKLKRLQHAIRNLNRRGFLFGAVFALTLQGLTAFIPQTGTYAEPADDLKIILEADARITPPVAGETPDMNIGSGDGEKYSVSLEYWYLFQGDNSQLTADSVFEEHEDYALRFIFHANEGYAFREDTAFTLNGQPTEQQGESITEREFIFRGDQEDEDRAVDVTFDFNGGTLGGEPTATFRTSCFGLEISDESMVTEPGVEVPNGKALNYVTINDEFFNLGDGYFLCEDVTIKYFWREDTGVLFTVEFDPNGGTVVDYDIPLAAPEGQTFMIHAPDETQILPPEGQEFDAFEINGVRYEDGVIFTVKEDSYFKLLWKKVGGAGAPNTGDYASEGGSAVIMSSVMMFVVMSGLMVWLFEKRNR